MSTPFYYLARLHLAAGTAELLPNEQAVLDARVAALWAQLLHATRRLAVPAGRAQPLLAQLLAALLGRPCCRRAVRQAVPLPEALGPLPWTDEAASSGPHPHWEPFWHGSGDS